jgi:hypothetical protein
MLYKFNPLVLSGLTEEETLEVMIMYSTQGKMMDAISYFRSHNKLGITQIQMISPLLKNHYEKYFK